MQPLHDREQVISAIANASLRSARAQEIDIFEIGNLNELLRTSDAEKIRKEFVKYRTPIRQITNHRRFSSWTDNSELTQQNLKVKYVSPETLQSTTRYLFLATPSAYTG